MKTAFDIAMQNRKAFSGFLKNTPYEDLVKIPSGFRNNIFWNIAHVVVIQQQLLYKRSGLEMMIDSDMEKKYGNGSVPEEKVSQEEIERIDNLLLSCIRQSREDYSKNIFREYKELTTRAGVVLKNIDDAIHFNTYHEGLHLGYIFSLFKAINN